MRALVQLAFMASIAGLLTVQPIDAQTTGRIEGTILDVSGEPLPGVTVIVKSPSP